MKFMQKVIEYFLCLSLIESDFSFSDRALPPYPKIALNRSENLGMEMLSMGRGKGKEQVSQCRQVIFQAGRGRVTNVKRLSTLCILENGLWPKVCFSWVYHHFSKRAEQK